MLILSSEKVALKLCDLFINILVGFPGVVRAFTTLKYYMYVPKPRPGAPAKIVTPLRPVPGSPRPAYVVSSLHLLNCANEWYINVFGVINPLFLSPMGEVTLATWNIRIKIIIIRNVQYVVWSITTLWPSNINFVQSLHGSCQINIDITRLIQAVVWR